MTDIHHGVLAFFDSYNDAFQRFDIEAATDHFEVPSFITSDAAEVALLPSRRERTVARASPW